MRTFTAVQIILALTSATAFTALASSDLGGYVRADDQAYRWEQRPHTDRHEGLTVHELRLISQVWQGITWEHRLRVIVPRAMQ